MRRSLRIRASIGVATGFLLILGLGACAGSDEDSPSSPGAVGSDGSAEAPADMTGGVVDEDESADRSLRLSQASLDADRRQVVRAGLVVRTSSVVAAAREAETIAVGAGGLVTDEDTQVDPQNEQTVSSMTLRVPPGAVDTVLTNLAELGTLVNQTRSAQDVTDEYVDVVARLDSQRASLDRLLSLVGTAGDLDDVIALEAEIARRQADLDALAARQLALDEEIDLATIALTLRSTDEPVVAPARTGFTGGLASGWDAFLAAMTAGLTVLGALLPFAIAGLLVGAPIWALTRRRRRETVSPAVTD